MVHAKDQVDGNDTVLNDSMWWDMVDSHLNTLSCYIVFVQIGNELISTM